MELDAVAIVAMLTTVACVLGIFAATFTILLRQDVRDQNVSASLLSRSAPVINNRVHGRHGER